MLRKAFKIIFMLAVLTDVRANAQTADEEIVPVKTAIKNVRALLDYTTGYLQLKRNFVAYDQQMHKITKPKFLRLLCTGNYLPIRLYSTNEEGEYRLYHLPVKTDPDIKSVLKQIGDTYYGYSMVLGKKFPAFRFQDLNGHLYTSENTKGKIIVLKAWFIACAPCVAEMPMLNRITENYRTRKDILFLSIAFDRKEALRKFSRQKEFKYAIIPVTEQYIEKSLHVTGYPAHWVINKQGIVVDMTYDKEEMIAALRKESSLR